MVFWAIFHSLVYLITIIITQASTVYIVLTTNLVTTSKTILYYILTVLVVHSGHNNIMSIVVIIFQCSMQIFLFFFIKTVQDHLGYLYRTFLGEYWINICGFIIYKTNLTNNTILFKSSNKWANGIGKIISNSLTNNLSLSDQFLLLLNNKQDLN